jgi:hypothetical protein
MQMKSIILAVIMVSGMTAKAGVLDFFDLTKFVEAALTAGEGVAINLEKIRLEQQKVLDIREQWDLGCASIQTINPDLLKLNKALSAAKINNKLCAPVTQIIKLNSDILMRCQDFYSKPVPDNAEFLLGKVAISLFQTKLLLNKCYPELKKVKLPGLP